MTNQRQTADFDPFAVLAVDKDADDECIRAAYLAKLRQFPPDRSPDEFEQIRDAYEMLRDRRRRAQYTLFSVNPDVQLQSLLKDMGSQRRFVGPSPWLAVLKGR